MSSWAPGFPLLEHHLHPLHIPAPTTAVCPEAARRTQALLAQGEKAAAASIAVPAFKHIHAGIHSAHTSSTFARAGKEPSADRSSLAALSTEKKQVCSRRINPSTSIGEDFSCSPSTIAGEGARLTQVLLGLPHHAQPDHLLLTGKEQGGVTTELTNCSLARINSARQFCDHC